MSKPFAAATERNKEPILHVLQPVFAQTRRVLEIGSGTGQHAVHFGRSMPHLVWQTSDLAEHHDGINAWLDETGLENVYSPIALDVRRHPWDLPGDIRPPDAVFSANTAHIMSWSTVTHMIAGVGGVLARAGVFCLYGPFNENGEYTSDSNREFDRMLKQKDPDMGIRDLAALEKEAGKNGMILESRFRLPANNEILVFRLEDGNQ